MFGQKEKKEKTLSPTEVINEILKKAITRFASDIHIQREQYEARVRLRIDGMLGDLMFISLDNLDAIISRLKIMANLNITERRMPQDGHLSLEVADTSHTEETGIIPQKTYDFRISVVPTLYGESIVLRVLNRETQLKDLENLGFTDENFEKVNQLIRKQNGIILLTGPSGSGKTTTLYSLLNKLNSKEKNIVTLEDPVEYSLPNIRQSQINTEAGFNFSAGLKALLRQDPNILMFGEIRDEETAEIAMRASLSGLLVFSTVHTNNALGTIIRLLDMNLGRSVVAQALSGVISQRLVRKICSSCAIVYQPNKELKEKLNIETKDLYKGSGCVKCGESGYLGRIAIQEVLLMTKEIRNLIIDYKSVSDFDKYMRSISFKNLLDDGLMKVSQGITTLEELLRVLGYERE